MKQVELCGQMVRVDEAGLISLTDMWKASGGDNNKRPSFFIENAGTQEYMRSLEKAGFPAFKKSQGKNGGTWGCKFLAYDYAAWIDPDFKFGVYKVLDKFFAGELQPAISPMDQLNAVVLKERSSLAKAKVASEWMHDRKREKKKLADEAKKAIEELQQSLDLLNFVGPKLLVKK
ncbi:KilA-N domain-containing protein [Endozoicomonas atrinae]|uniref:KilA-N domain-containing protein n=1 Tax=Endozoicomonas atrinae TaxID=1333660 RepID=UPI003B007083